MIMIHADGLRRLAARMIFDARTRKRGVILFSLLESSWKMFFNDIIDVMPIPILRSSMFHAIHVFHDFPRHHFTRSHASTSLFSKRSSIVNVTWREKNGAVAWAGVALYKNIIFIGAHRIIISRSIIDDLNNDDYIPRWRTSRHAEMPPACATPADADCRRRRQRWRHASAAGAEAAFSPAFRADTRRPIAPRGPCCP